MTSNKSDDDEITPDILLLCFVPAIGTLLVFVAIFAILTILSKL